MAQKRESLNNLSFQLVKTGKIFEIDDSISQFSLWRNTYSSSDPRDWKEKTNLFKNRREGEKKKKRRKCKIVRFEARERGLRRPCFFFFLFSPDADKKRYRDSRTMRWLLVRQILFQRHAATIAFTVLLRLVRTWFHSATTGDPRKNPPPCEHVKSPYQREMYTTRGSLHVVENVELCQHVSRLSAILRSTFFYHLMNLRIVGRSRIVELLNM